MQKPFAMPSGAESKAFPKIPPDPKMCRTSPIGSSLSFADCLVEGPNSCPYLVLMGKAKFCTHPHWDELVQCVIKAG